MMTQDYFLQNALDLAPSLLGKILIHEIAEGLASGMIVETEAYSQEDAASHSYNGETARTKAMFGPGGHAYIYFTYGMHYCFNVVSGNAGHGQGVLIRALEPVDGLDLMKSRRAKDEVKILCNGPAKLVQAMGITKNDYGKPLFNGNLRIEEYKDIRRGDIVQSPRIGISKERDKKWRFHIKNNDFVSKP